VRNLTRLMGGTRQFECKDGRWFMYHAGNKHASDFANQTGVSSLLSQGSTASLEELSPGLEALFKTRTAAEWEAFCEQVETGAIPGRRRMAETSRRWVRDHRRLDRPGARCVPRARINVGCRDSVRVRRPRVLPDADRASIPLTAKAAAPSTTAARSDPDGPGG
jgi:hypothetical protein